MIKKLNIALAVAFAALVVLKMLSSLADGSRPRADAGAPADVAAASAAPAIAPPDVYYSYWASFSVEDEISNRNGVLLDTVRAIFPGARFVRINSGETAEFAKALAENPRAVVVGFGDHPELSLGAKSVLPMAYARVVLMTLRSNPWRYEGPESLDGMRIAVPEDFLDYDALRKMAREPRPGGPVAVVVPSSTSIVELARMVDDGEADGYVAIGVRTAAGWRVNGANARLSLRFHPSDEIARGDLLFRVSSLDPDYAAAAVEAYEEGLRRIDASGERARIFEYYEMAPAPPPPRD